MTRASARFRRGMAAAAGALAFALGLGLAAPARAKILCPMDQSQTDHLKAYGLAFWALGFSAPVFWGVVMGLFCLLPLGAWIVWGPAALWLILGGDLVRGLVLAAIGIGLVSAVDNFLRPILLSGRSQMNGLLLFVSLLGAVVR